MKDILLLFSLGEVAKADRFGDITSIDSAAVIMLDRIITIILTLLPNSRNLRVPTRGLFFTPLNDADIRDDDIFSERDTENQIKVWIDYSSKLRDVN